MPAVLHHHAFTGKALLMPGGTDYLPQGLLHIVMVMVEIPLPGHIDGIPVRLVMGHPASVIADRHEVVFHFQQKVIEPDMQFAVIGFRMAFVCGISVLLQCSLVGFPVNIGQRGLVDIEKGAYLPVMHALVMFPVLCVQSEIGRAADNLLRIVPVDILVPVVEKERHATLMFPDGCAHCLGFVEKGEQVRPASVPVRMEGHEQPVEGTDGHTARIEFRIALAGGIQPVSVCTCGTVQGFGEQFYLLLLRIFLYG